MSHGDVICLKCGARGSTKCPHTRTVFPEHQVETFYGNLMSVERASFKTWEGKETSLVDLNVTIKIVRDKSVNPKESDDEYIAGFFEGLLKGNLNIREIFCDHEWGLLPGFKSGSADCDCSYEKQSAKAKRKMEKAVARFPE